jgi:hypothetical protein
VSTNRRHLVDANSQPFFIHGDTPWSLEVQCTHAQIDAYLDDRRARGFNAILFQCMEHWFSSQTPPWRNAQSGALPFTNVNDFATTVEAYWRTVDHIVDGAKARGIACFITHSYLGFGGGEQGWNAEVNAQSATQLRAWGAWLARRYAQGNVVWVAGGDFNPPTPSHQWAIHEGIRSVRGTDLMSGHGARNTEAWTVWNGLPGFNLNAIYCDVDGVAWDDAQAAYARSGPMPFFLIEGGYGGAESDAVVRMQVWQAVLGGACGHFFGSYPVWGLGEPKANWGIGAAQALSPSYLGSTATVQVGHVRSLLASRAWWRLAPANGTTLVTSALGSGAARVCPALADDRSFAMVWTPSRAVTVNLAALAPARLRARWYHPQTGALADADGGADFANGGSRVFTPPGERVLLIEAA